MRYSQRIHNPCCSEIIQVQKPSVINDDQSYEVLGTDISCNLGSTNVPRLMESKDFGKSISTMVKALTYVTDNTSIEAVPTVKKGNDQAHTIGLGAMGLHAFLAKNQIHYGSEEALDFTNIYFMLIKYHALSESNRIAIQREQAFVGFEKSKYADGSYLNKYIEKEWQPKTEKVAELFTNMHIPTQSNWKELSISIQESGIYHQNLMAVAP